MRLELSREADEDLRRIYLVGAAQFGVEVADRYAARLIDALSLIADFPHIARVRDNLSGEVRAYPVLSHIIIYKVMDEVVLVARIRHGREDWQSA